MIVKPLPNQTLLDIALQFLGDAGQAYVIAEMNGLTVTSDLSGITSLILPDELVNPKLVQQYEERRIVPGSQYFISELLPPAPEFIMTEDNDFLTTEVDENLETE